MEDDNHSVCSANSKASTNSTTQEHIPCHYCNKDFQKRSMFKHVRSKHPFQFLDNCSDIKEDKPLRVTYEYQDDHGDTDYIIYYACLASNKTFQTQERALQNWKKNPKLQIQHNQELKTLIKDRKKYLERCYQECTYSDRLAKLKLNNDPAFCRAIWSSILQTSATIYPIQGRLAYLPQDNISIEKSCGLEYEKMTIRECIEFITKTRERKMKLEEEKCLKYRPLNDIWLRYQRILAMRSELSFDPTLWPKSINNPEGYQTATDEWGLTFPDCPKVDF